MTDHSTELAGQALESLVSQFSSALDCLRELVQNSMDAGTAQVDVWMDFEPPAAEQPGGEGVISLHVDDGGSGMDEAIIDQQLTRLFASSKEGDLTKIGKFGIGFVSIFALGPQAVLLHTGRGGQYWEVLFLADRSFTKTAVTTPVEGTQITLFVAGDEPRYLHLVQEARATLRRWCRHSEVEIFFEDRSGLVGAAGSTGPESINEPFELPGLVSVKVATEGTEMALCYDLRPTYAFFNKGLTLAELRDPDEVPARFANIAFKIKSRYLEHTLSRETVLRDENYEKAMRLLGEAADGPLHEALLGALSALVAQPEWGLAEEGRYQQLIAFLTREPVEAIRTARRRPILRTVGGKATSLAALASAARRWGWIFASDTPSALARELTDEGAPVLFSRAPLGGEQEQPKPAAGAEAAVGEDESAPRSPSRGSLCAALRLAVAFVADEERGRPLQRVLSLFTQKDYGAQAAARVVRPEEVYWAVQLDEHKDGQDGALIGNADRLLQEVGAGYRRLQGCVLGAQPGRSPLFLVADRLGGRMAIPPPYVSPEERPKRPEAAVNREHPHYRALVRLHRRAPGLAAYGLAKALLLFEDRLPERDLELLRRALAEIDGVPCGEPAPTHLAGSPGEEGAA